MTPTVSERGRPWRWIALVCALALLNASLTFRNVWPTPGVEWTGDLSIELAVFVLGLSLATRRFGAPPGWLITWLAGLWLLLTIGRYADVTAPAVYGREINLYWDVRHMGAVASMLATAVSPWIVAAVLVAVVLISHVAHRFLRWAIGCVAEAMTHPRERRALGRDRGRRLAALRRAAHHQRSAGRPPVFHTGDRKLRAPGTPVHDRSVQGDDHFPQRRASRPTWRPLPAPTCSSSSWSPMGL